MKPKKHKLELAKQAACAWALWAVTLLAGSPRGYLPVLGPAPLRFEPSLTPRRMVALPPLLMGEPDPVQAGAEPTNNSDHQAGAPPDPASLSNSLPSVPPIAGPSSDALQSNYVQSIASSPIGSLDESSDAALVTPQMLVQYFMSPVTNHAASVLVPAFIPPISPSKPPSSATYKTP
ncbi:MAG: hypothetical protein M1608_09710 [Candidatus Omnitrophica bacterium]|nr:hypothetical protein [Candidatus Omnitrophota bacterium]